MNNKPPIEIAKEISLKRMLGQVKEYKNYLLTKWKIILVFGFGGALIGLGLSFAVKPKYNANLSFVLIERSSGGGGLASLASSLGISNMIGFGSSSAFSGDNLLEIIKSRHAVEKTLLTPINFNGKYITMMDAYIQFNDLHKEWKNSKKIELRSLNYPVNLKREAFTRVQDSVLYSTYKGFIESNNLRVVRKDKKIGVVNVDFTSKNELFSKLFVENLIDQTYQFYKDTRTVQSRVNIEMMEHTADSIRRLYENALYGSASVSQVNINPALQTAVVPKIKQENDAQLYGAVYAEVLKNLETLKLDLARETPIMQIVDTPRYPLKVKKIGKIKGVVFGGGIGGILIVLFLLGKFNLKDVF
ncbi:MAG: hypothetical protein PHZ12_02110 [Paludibacter sp.]|nr:hypothetical protein [Paludibacter sp.]MDD4426891.1 hypothetical protein [Paludibacter sp.]